MTKSFEVLIQVETALKKLKDADSGHLIGIETGNTVSIVGLVVKSSQDASQDEMEILLPHPLAIVGPAVGAANSSTASQGLQAKLSAGGAITYTCNGSTVSPSVVSTNPLYSRCALVRCAIDSTLEAPAGGDVAAAVYALEAQLRGPRTIFSMRPSSNPAAVSLCGSQDIESCGGSLEGPGVMDAFTDAGFGSRDGTLSAPLAEAQPAKGKIRWSTLHLDVLCFVPKGTSAADAVKTHVVPALSRQLRALRTLVGGTRRPFRAVHFSPPSMYHPITVLYPLPTPATEADESSLHATRRALHAVLGLPLDRPLLRLANAIDPGNLLGTSSNSSEAGQNSSSAGGGSSATRRLSNVHQGLPPSGVQGGTQCLVLGEYDYYHYMQDKFDDSGWGCAYRSLQTICSWFKRQHYTARAPPGHREIQTELVKLGDKGQEFIGSRQWIGAIELGYILDALLGVECKVMTVQSGADMPSKAREIAQHFETQGTPIMIGGGVLAYTLLGIDYNENSGETAFLILDPHYTGADDLGRIHSGQWVAWKRLGDKAAAGGELFVANAFYNLLCPQRPSTV